MQEVVKKEIVKLLDTSIIYPIADSPWVSPIHCVPKKGGIMVVTNEKNELVPTRIVTGWRVCIDYQKLNEATTKDHFPLPFMDQILERLVGNKYICFLDGFSGYFQIPVDPMDQEKTTFTCPFGTYAYRRMPFGLCNAPATFQRCMLAIFHDMIEESVEVFMNDFFVFRSSFDHCLNNLDKMLQCCKDAHLVFNWEKCHFMVKEGIMLGHKVSEAGLEVDKVKIEVISKLPPPTNIKGIRSFVGHAGFYQRFIKDFSKIARPLTKLLKKDTSFEFNEECHNAFELLKEKLICAHVIVSPNWSLPFELMCDASDFAVRAILGQKEGRNFHPIYFASKTLNTTQQNYTITKKESIVVVFAFDKFRSYLVLSKTIMQTDHSALRHLFKNQDAKPRLIRWILLLQEFDIEIKDRKETLMGIDTENDPWFADFANYLEEPCLFKVCFDGMIRRCVSGPETQTILDQCHPGPTSGHYGPNTTAKKVLDSGFYWPTIIKEAHTQVRLCEACQKTGNISKRDEMPLNNIQIMEKTMKRYGVNHRFSTSYHPQTSGQVKNTNRDLKRILEKTVKDNPAIWLKKLDDALWAFRIAYKTPTGTTPYKLIYGKNCHLPFEIKHRAYWPLKNCNPDLIAAGEKRMFQLHELDELRHQAYENSRLYKARTKVWHDRKLKIRKEFKHRNKVLLFHSKYKFKQPKLRSRWLGPYVVKHQYPSRYVKIFGKDGKTFIVNGHRLKLYHEEEDYNDQKEAVTPLFPKE
ncbi:reverse transcriptase domain-containing protein [Tanacetum coccineum]